MRRSTIRWLLMLSMLGGTVPARASQINIRLADVNAGVCCFGNQANYWAQLFTAIAPNPVSLTFYVLAGKAWFPYFRLYGPTEAHFNRTWVLPNIERVA